MYVTDRLMGIPVRRSSTYMKHTRYGRGWMLTGVAEKLGKLKYTPGGYMS